AKSTGRGVNIGWRRLQLRAPWQPRRIWTEGTICGKKASIHFGEGTLRQEAVWLCGRAPKDVLRVKLDELLEALCDHFDRDFGELELSAEPVEYVQLRNPSVRRVEVGGLPPVPREDRGDALTV